MLVALFAVGCDTVGPAHVVVARSPLLPDVPVEADLDGDGSLETVLFDSRDLTIFIEDGSVSYRSRDCWRVMQAALADTDGDGLTEVVTLIDSSRGRHIGLFAFFGGVYRERLVSRPIDPAPVSFAIIPAGMAGAAISGTAMTAPGADARGNDLLELVQPPLEPGGAPQVLLLRWNGFGFTRVEPSR